MRFSTLQINSSIANNFILQAYIDLWCCRADGYMSLWVLSCSNLDAGQYKYRFSITPKLGVEEKHIGKLILQQLSVWFGLPIITAIISRCCNKLTLSKPYQQKFQPILDSLLMLQIGNRGNFAALWLLLHKHMGYFRRSVNPIVSAIYSKPSRASQRQVNGLRHR